MAFPYTDFLSLPPTPTHNVAFSAAPITAHYLTAFNEIVMLIERLPDVPDLAVSIMAWRAITHRDIFAMAPLAQTVIPHPWLEGLDPAFRYEFENLLCTLDEQTAEAVASLRQQMILQREMPAHTLRPLCEAMSGQIRPLLERAAELINHAVTRADEIAQRRADRLLANRLRLLGETEKE